MLRRLARVLLLLVPLAALTAGNAHAATTPLAAVGDDSPMSAAGGWVAWSERDPATGAWHLVTWHSGVRAVAPVPPRTVPFDVDLGRDGRGRTVATYSRCLQDPRAGGPRPDLAGAVTAFAARGCTLRQLDLASGTERRLDVRRPVGALDVTPSRDGAQIAFARRLPGERVFRLLVTDERTHRTRELPHGTMPRRQDDQPATGEVDALDLGPRALGFVWRVEGAPVGTGTAWETRLVRLRDRARLLVGTGYVSGACGATIPSSPSVSGTALWFAEERVACDLPLPRVVRAGFDAPGGRQLADPTVLVHRVSRVGGVLYEVREPASAPGQLALQRGFCHDAARPCQLVQVTPPPRLPDARRPLRGSDIDL